MMNNNTTPSLPPPRLHCLIYGPPKTRKTWWALYAAHHGFTVTHLCGDPGGYAVMNNPAFDTSLPSLINTLDISDLPNKPVMSTFLSAFFKQKAFWYDTTTKEIHLNPGSIPGDNPCWNINPSGLGMADLLVFDSLSANSWGITWSYAINNHVDLSEAEKQDWDGWGWMGRLASWHVGMITALPCHAILIGHSTVYEKRKQEGSGKNKKTVIEWTRTIPKSTSGPHGMTISQEFNEVLFTNLVGENVYINTAPSRDREGGSRVLPPRNYQWDQLQISNIAQAYGIPPINPPKKSEAFTFYQHAKEMQEWSNSMFAKKQPSQPVQPVTQLTGKPVVLAMPVQNQPVTLATLMGRK